MHASSGGRIFAGVAFLIVLGLGFIYQQITDVAGAKPIDVSRQIKAVQEPGIPTEGILSSRSVREDASSAAKALSPGDRDENIEIAKAISAYRSSLDDKDIASFANIIREESKKHGYDWELILAIMKTESDLNARARSKKGAIGLMQVMPSTARWLSLDLGLDYEGHSSLYDPKYNVRLGAHYLHIMHQKFGDIERAVAAYNRGPTGLIRYLRQGREFPSRYLAKVMGYYRELKNVSGKCAAS